jgi:hypothetical protein
MSNSEIQNLIQSFASQLEAAAKKAAIEQVIASLGGSAAPARRGRGPGRPKGSKNAPKSEASGSPQDMGPALLDYVRANPGSRADQIAKALRTTPDKMRKSMQALLDSKQVKRSGVRRGTTYHVAGATPAQSAPKQTAASNAPKKRGPRARKRMITAGQSLRSRLVGLSARKRK